MTRDFTSFSTVFQSYQDDERLIMKGSVQWSSVYGWEDPIGANSFFFKASGADMGIA